MNINNKKFRSISTSNNGEVSSDTIFHYRQDENIIWATYNGGTIEFGTLVGKIKNNRLTFMYQHLNQEGEYFTGHCETIISLEKGKMKLNEKWQWTCKDYSKGTSLLEEI